jgi:hypothetical protein
MSSSTTTDLLRKWLADQFEASLTTGQMAFGDGGHDPVTEDVIAATQDQETLHNQLIIHNLHATERVDDYSVKVTGRLLKPDVVGYEISEAGLFVGGELKAVRNFGPKTKEDDEIYDVDITVLF